MIKPNRTLKGDRSLLHSVGVSIAVGLATAAVMMAVHSFADQDPTTDDVPRQIPYRGYIEQDAAPFNAEREWMRFDVLDLTAGPDNNPAAGTVVYQQSMQVNITNGHFVALLGPVDDNGVILQQMIAGADRLAVRMHMLNAHNPLEPDAQQGDDVALDPPKPLLPSPYAVWAATASDFDVAGSLNVGGQAQLNTVTVEGGFTSASLSAGSAAVGTLALGGNNGNPDFETIQVDSVEADALTIGSNRFSGFRVTEHVFSGSNFNNPTANLFPTGSVICGLTEHTRTMSAPSSGFTATQESYCEVAPSSGSWRTWAVASPGGSSSMTTRCRAVCIHWDANPTPNACNGRCNANQVCIAGQCQATCNVDGCFDEATTQGISVGQTINGNLDANVDPRLGYSDLSQRGAAQLYDAYTLTLQPGQSVEVIMNSSGGNQPVPELQVYSPNSCELLATDQANTGSNRTATVALNSAEGGCYTILASSRQDDPFGDTGSYSLTVEAQP